MENLSGEQAREQGQQVTAEPTRIRPPPTAEQLARFAASHHQMRQKRAAPEAFTVEVEAPARRIEAPKSTGVHNQRFMPSSSAMSGQQVPAVTPVDPSHPALESSTMDTDPSDLNHIQPVTAALSTNADLREQLREEIRKEMELLYDSRLAKRTSELETIWRGKREERTKEVENYWKQKLAEAVSSSRDDKTRDLHEEIGKLKTRLDKGPGLIKAAEERGRRQGELDGYNKLSLNPELKPSQDRLNFDFLMKEKDKELTEVKTTRDIWFRDARKFSEEINAKLQAKDREIEYLQAQAQSRLPQQPLAPHNTEALIAKGRELQEIFDNQTQELVSLRQKCNQQADDLANWTAGFNQKSQESSDREQQLGVQSAELSEVLQELEKKTKEVSILRRESDQKALELEDSSKELEKQSGEINVLREERQQDSKELVECRRKIEAQSIEIANLQTRHDGSESLNKEKDRKIASLRELLDSSSSNQSSGPDQEEIKLLQGKLAENQSLLNEARSENAVLRDHQARRELEELTATSETDSAVPTEAEAELVRAMLVKEREKNEAENSRRENRVNATLEGLEDTERERRQMLIDELENKDAALHDAQKQIRELEQQLLASSSSQSSQSPTSALNTSHASQALPISAHPSPPIILTSSATGPSSSTQRLRFPAPRGLLIVALIFFLAFFAPCLQSLANSDLQDELVSIASRDDRLQWEAWELANRERNEGIPTYEESWRRTQEVGQMGGWGP